MGVYQGQGGGYRNNNGERHLREYEAFVQHNNKTGDRYFRHRTDEEKEHVLLQAVLKESEATARAEALKRAANERQVVEPVRNPYAHDKKMKRLAQTGGRQGYNMGPAISTGYQELQRIYNAVSPQPSLHAKHDVLKIKIADKPRPSKRHLSVAAGKLSEEEWRSKNLTYFSSFNTSSPTFWEFWNSPIHNIYQFTGMGNNTRNKVMLFAINKRLEELGYIIGKYLGCGGSKIAFSAYRLDDENEYVLRFSVSLRMYTELILAEKFRNDFPWADEVIAKSYCYGQILMKEEAADFCPDAPDKVLLPHAYWEIMEKVLSFDSPGVEEKGKIEDVLRRNYNSSDKFDYDTEVTRLHKELRTVRGRSNWIMMDDKERQCGMPRGCYYAVTYDIDFRPSSGRCKDCGFEQCHCIRIKNEYGDKSWTKVTLNPKDDPNPRPHQGEDARRKFIQ